MPIPLKIQSFHLSYIVQETCSDGLISEEGPEMSSVFLIINKGPCTLFYSI